MRRCWTEIDLDAVRNNYRIYESLMPEGRRVMGVVKADAYGHGDVQVARALQEIGCRDFAAATLTEAIKLRKAGIEGLLIILGYTPVECAADLAAYDITQAVVSEEYAEALDAECRRLSVKVKGHVALDTGMNRIGINAAEPEACIAYINSLKARDTADGGLDITGVFTHLCVADSASDDDINFTGIQIAEFMSVAYAVDVDYRHCLNSAGGVWYPDAGGCFARLGIILYGLKPDPANELPEGIRPVLSWKAVIAMVKDIYPGEDVGYGRTFHVDRPMRIATVPTGYADGYPRILSNKGYVLIHGKKADIVGRVCMDQMMVDVTDIPDAAMGDEVVLIGESEGAYIGTGDLAQMAQTIPHEIVCGINARVERHFFENGQEI